MDQWNFRRLLLFQPACFLWVDCDAGHCREAPDTVVYVQLSPYAIIPPGEWRVAMGPATRSWTADTMCPSPVALSGLMPMRFNDFSPTVPGVARWLRKGLPCAGSCHCQG
jgi:hypothetical protein